MTRKPVGRHGDGNGLYLYVQRTGTRSWIQRLVIRGRKHELGLGRVQLVSLAEAREQALANRKLARAGGDPIADRRRLQGMPTFAEAAATVVEQKRAGWRSPRQAVDWLHSLQRYALPRIGSRLVSEVSSADVLAVLTPIWHGKPDTARRVRQRISAVLEWGVAMEHRTDNSCDLIGPLLGPQRDVVRHMRALPHRDVAGAIGTVRASKATRAVKLAFEFLVLTAAPSGEVRLATWDEIDTAGRVWTIVAERMKMNREHRVPLSPRALEVLDAARSLADGNPLVFPNRWGNASGIRSCRSCSRTWTSRPCLMVSARRSGTGRRKRPTTRGRSSRRRWRRSSATRSRRPTRGRTCSSAGGCSWRSGPPTLTASRGRTTRLVTERCPRFAGQPPRARLPTRRSEH